MSVILYENTWEWGRTEQVFLLSSSTKLAGFSATCLSQNAYRTVAALDRTQSASCKSCVAMMTHSTHPTRLAVVKLVPDQASIEKEPDELRDSRDPWVRGSGCSAFVTVGEAVALRHREAFIDNRVGTVPNRIG